MVTVIFIAIVLWQIVKMMNKSKSDQAKREENRKRQIAMNAREAQPAPTPVPSREFMQENDDYNDTSDRWDLTNEAGSFLKETLPDSLLDPATDAPEYVSRLTFDRASLRRKRAEVGVRDDYAIQTAPVRRAIRLDKESLRTYILLREVLGAPRSRERYHPGTRR